MTNALAHTPPVGHADIAPTRFERIEGDGYLTLDAPWIVPALLRSVPNDTSDTGVQSATVDQRAEAIHRGMARLLRLLPDSASPHEPRSVDPSKIAFVSLAAVANRAKPLQRTMPSRHIEVQCGGGGRLAHGHLANVRTPVGPTGAAQQLFRLARSPPNLRARPSLTRSNRRGTDPYARWCGRGDAARCPPIPINPLESPARAVGIISVSPGR